MAVVLWWAQVAKTGAAVGVIAAADSEPARGHARLVTRWSNLNEGTRVRSSTRGGGLVSGRTLCSISSFSPSISEICASGREGGRGRAMDARAGGGGSAMKNGEAKMHEAE
jgi:hypothetical protein